MDIFKSLEAEELCSRNSQLSNFDRLPPDSYFEEEYKLLNSSRSVKGTIYDMAMTMEIRSSYDLENLEYTAQLNHIKDEIKLRTKITGLEVFKIGRLLHMAKAICKVNKIRFGLWLEDNVDFEYETAINHMHVYKYCLGFMSVAINIPPSLLYKISAPSFPNELREYLFEQGNLENMTNMDLSELLTEYKHKGFESIKNKVETWNKESIKFRQTKLIMDKCYNIHRSIRTTCDSINNKFGYIKHPSKGKQEQKNLFSESNDINKGLLDALYDSLILIEKAIEKAEDQVFNFECQIKDKLEM